MHIAWATMFTKLLEIYFLAGDLLQRVKPLDWYKVTGHLPKAYKLPQVKVQIFPVFQVFRLQKNAWFIKGKKDTRPACMSKYQQGNSFIHPIGEG